ncbi:hypothetical protein PTTG_03380 [Puccinia triticina 1-1 BBBD Race 1]|uniref:C2H2-type domain-containing protein n=1 Tax=Puccinia triticina (isolate 1-1 / race 1 (BBBD)) TaxID=630390 RepID=A0A180GPI5_PUCT1|nr:hypothetical protein PTTG_03380 [Puccinia triticina 1-1 BBBD Race 1]WAR60964.1 hypothetical protein PtB15_13B215 [Puccinia triticina]
MKQSYPFTSTKGAHPLSSKTRGKSASQTVSIGPFFPNPELLAILSPLSSPIQNDRNQPNLDVNVPLAETSSSKQALTEPLFPSFSHHAGSTVTGEVHSAQSQNQYVCHGSLALGTYSRQPRPAYTMCPSSTTMPGPHHSGSVMCHQNITMSSTFGSFLSTSVVADHGTESCSRRAATGVIGYAGRTASPPMGGNSSSYQSTDFLSSTPSTQDAVSSMDLNNCSRVNGEWLFTNPFGAAVPANQSSEHHTGRELSLEESLLSEALGKPDSELLSFLTSNFSVGENSTLSSQDGNHVHETLQKGSPSIGINFSTGLESTCTPAASPSKSTASVKIESPEGYANRKLFNSSALENFGNELSKYKNVSQAQPIGENVGLEAYPSSTSSNSSSHSSSPSLSSSSTLNSRSSSYSPCHSSVDLSHFNEASTFSQNVPDTLFENDFYERAPEDLINVDTQPNFFNPIANEGHLGLESFYPLQHHIQQQQQQLLHQLELQQLWQQDLQRQQSWSQGLRPQIPEMANFFNSTQYPDVQSTNFQAPPALKPIFICHKCGKGHTRQSNLLAHLRDTHSQVKKVACDFPGCTKSYKRVSECRRHKKDLHGIPLPSELSGKVRKPRSTISSMFRPSKFQSA